MGYMRKGKGVIIHASSCRKIRFSETIKIVNVEWNPDDHSKHSVNMKVTAHDKPGILSIISKEINKTGVEYTICRRPIDARLQGGFYL